MDRKEMTELRERARRACDETAVIRERLEVTCAETAALIARSRQIHSLGPCLDQAVAPPPLVSIEPSEHDLAMDVLRMMRALLEGFPLDWQVKIVKALTARTLLVVAAQSRSQTITLSA